MSMTYQMADGRTRTLTLDLHERPNIALSNMTEEEFQLLDAAVRGDEQSETGQLVYHWTVKEVRESAALTELERVGLIRRATVTGSGRAAKRITYGYKLTARATKYVQILREWRGE